jgi:hypothetical protein
MISFIKKGNEFKFEGKETQYGIKYTYTIISNNKEVSGYNATLERKKKAMTFAMQTITIDGKERKVNGVLLEEEVLKKFIDFEDGIIQAKKDMEKEFIKKIVSGELKIEWYETTKYFDGYAYPEKKFRIEIPKNIDKTEILEEAVKECGIEGYCYDIHEYIERSIPDEEKNGYMALKDILKNKLKKQKERQEKRNAIFTKAKETGEKQEIRHYVMDCNDPKEECNTDVVYEYAMPDGTITKNRIHTY